MPRTQITALATNKTFTEKNKSLKKRLLKEEVNKATENILIAKILVYSAIKISAKGPLLYSVLNPETSSDSPSARSKGVRLVSASRVTNQSINRGKIIIAVLERKCEEEEIKL